jgi:hypothetical protein
MEMKVEDALASPPGHVGEDAHTPLRNPLFLGEFFYHLEDLDEQGTILFSKLEGGGEMFPGNHQKMNGRLGIDIPEGNHLVIGIEYLRLQLTVCDLAENAIFHWLAPLSTANYLTK